MSLPRAAFPAGLRCTPSSVKSGEVRSDERRDASSMSITWAEPCAATRRIDPRDQLDLGAEGGALAAVDAGRFLEEVVDAHARASSSSVRSK